MYKYIDESVEKSKRDILKPLIEKLEAEVKKDSLKPSTLKKIGETIKTWGPVALTITDSITKLTGLRP